MTDDQQTIEIPDGFHEWPHDAQMAYLRNHRSSELANEIAMIYGQDSPRAGQLNKEIKAAIIADHY